VNIFFDTTVLVAASARSHPHYSRARPALLRVAAGKDKGFMSAHSIAEVYAALTRLPVHPRIHPTEAARIVVENILAILRSCSDCKAGLSGGAEEHGRWGIYRCKNLRRPVAAVCIELRAGLDLHILPGGLPATGIACDAA
jgi:PIN domain